VNLWQFILAADNRLDLAKLDKAREWLFSLPWWPTSAGKPTDANWTERAQRNWQENLVNLRSLVRRLKGERAKHEVPLPADPWTVYLHDETADQALGRYLDMLRVQVGREQVRVAEGHAPQAMSRKTYRGMVIMPTVADLRGERSCQPHHPAFYPANDFDYFWQCVFFSLVHDDTPVFCEGCGRKIGDGLTRKGRVMRQKLCSSCRHQKWKQKQSKKTLREMWKRYYHKSYRSEQHGTQTTRKG
jgi:hypothetical protein